MAIVRLVSFTEDKLGPVAKAVAEKLRPEAPNTEAYCLHDGDMWAECQTWEDALATMKTYITQPGQAVFCVYHNTLVSVVGESVIKETPTQKFAVAKNKPVSKALYPCGKCDATGYIPHYDHVSEGVCFECGGSGKSTTRRRKLGLATA